MSSFVLQTVTAHHRVWKPAGGSTWTPRTLCLCLANRPQELGGLVRNFPHLFPPRLVFGNFPSAESITRYPEHLISFGILRNHEVFHGVPAPDWDLQVQMKDSHSPWQRTLMCSDASAEPGGLFTSPGKQPQPKTTLLLCILPDHQEILWAIVCSVR